MYLVYICISLNHYQRRLGVYLEYGIRTNVEQNVCPQRRGRQHDVEPAGVGVGSCDVGPGFARSVLDHDSQKQKPWCMSLASNTSTPISLPQKA